MLGHSPRSRKPHGLPLDSRDIGEAMRQMIPEAALEMLMQPNTHVYAGEVEHYPTDKVDPMGETVRSYGRGNPVSEDWYMDE